MSDQYDQNLLLDWESSVPGSGAPEKITVAAVQALENRGYADSDLGYAYLRQGLKACEKKDFVTLRRCSALLRRELADARRDESSAY